MSGVARHCQDHFQDQYVAGLWRRTLEQQLCWAVDRQFASTHERQKAFPYRVPSWSSASMEQPVTWQLYSTIGVLPAKCRQSLLGRATDATLVSVGSDPLGQLQDATLQLTCGPLINLKVISSFVDTYENTLEGKSYEVSVSVHEKVSIRGYGYLKYDRDEDHGNVVAAIYFLPIQEGSHAKKARLKYPAEAVMYGIMVTIAEGQQKGISSRLGVLNIVFNLESHGELMRLLSTQPNELMDKSLYQDILESDENSLKQYVVTLV